MPTVLQVGPYRFQFYSADINEPPHVHVKRERRHVKFWLEPGVSLEFNRGFAEHEVNVSSGGSSSNTGSSCWSSGMISSPVENELMVPAKRVVVTEHHLVVDLADGRTVSTPLTWYPRLLHGTPVERANVEIDDYGLHWPDLDEDVSIKGLLLGRRSGESQKSLNRWLEHRARGEKVPVPTFPLPTELEEELKRGE